MGVGVCAYVEGSAWDGWVCTCIKGREREEGVFLGVVWSGCECVNVYAGLWAVFAHGCKHALTFLELFFISGILYRVIRKTGKQIIEPTLDRWN